MCTCRIPLAVDDVVTVFQVPVWVGWTTATDAFDLADMSARLASGNRSTSDCIFALWLFPLDAWRHALRAVPAANELARARAPPCFDEESVYMADLTLDRAHRDVHLHTEFNGANDFELPGPGGPIPTDLELRFFFVVQSTSDDEMGSDDTPRPRLGSALL